MKTLTSVFLAFFMLMVLIQPVQAATVPWWQFQSIDTMKYSRDDSRQYLNDPVGLSQATDTQVKAIAATGATHVAIATPYDDEFLPVLEAWVNAARRYHLNVWFRGNWSGWEGWFGYASINRQEHLQKTTDFIKNHPDLFVDGDVFSACPECENGNPGDPRQTGDVTSYRAFLIGEYQAMNQAFRVIHKHVITNFNSMNGDVARLVMDKPTTQALGGLVVIDHYVKTPEELNSDITDIANQSGGQVVLGEFGAPIPDIQGDMTDDQQAAWLKKTLSLLASNPHLAGLNYWTSQGGSTALWHENGQPKSAVSVLTDAYSPKTLTANVIDQQGNKVTDGQVVSGPRSVALTDGRFEFPYIDQSIQLTVSATGYQPQTLTIAQISAHPVIQLQANSSSLIQRLLIWLRKFIH